MRARRAPPLTCIGIASVFCVVAACSGKGSSADRVDAPTDGPHTCSADPAEIAVCSNDSDCTTYLDGCYCGAQPVSGVNNNHAAAVWSCEAAEQQNCGLGCANFPGYVAEDGTMVDSSAMIRVHCEPATNLCKTYVP